MKKINIVKLVALSVFLIPSLTFAENLNPYQQLVKIVDEEGSISFTDGSSIYMFRSDGSFTSGPHSGASGRTIEGFWSRNRSVVYGEWKWINGLYNSADFRRMEFHMGSPPTLITDERAEKVNSFLGREVKLYEFYFIIEELVKINLDEFHGAKDRVFNKSLQSDAPKARR